MRNANRPQVFEYEKSGRREPCTKKAAGRKVRKSYERKNFARRNVLGEGK